MTHWFLLTADSQKAYHVIKARPNGTVRTWARDLGWNPSRVVRYLEGLKRHGVAEVQAFQKGTVVTFRPDIELQPAIDAPDPRAGCQFRKDLSPKLRFAVMKRDNFRCVYCGASGKDAELVVDHLVPVAKGGSDDESNLATACVTCNNGKGDSVLPVPPVPARNTTEQNGTAPYLGVKSLDNSNNEVPRYAVTAADCVELIVAANRILQQREWEPIPEDNRGSITAATKILRIVPVDRAISLLEAAVRLFNPSATGGEQLRSLGHPFITKYVINEFRRTERDLVQGQLTLLFVERTGPPQQVFGARKPSEPEKPPATADTIAAASDEFRRIANGDQPPPRRQ